MIYSPYESTALKGKSIDKVTNALNLIRASGALQQGQVVNAPGIYCVVGRSPAMDTIPEFSQPIEINGTYAVDLRSYGTYVANAIASSKPVDQGPAGVAVRHAILQTIWNRGPETRKELLTLGDLPIATFSGWVSDALGRVLYLDGGLTADIAALAAWFYLCGYNSELKVEDDLIFKYASKISRATFIPVERCVAVITEAGHLRDLTAFAKAVENLPSRRTDRVNVPLIITTLGGSWFSSTNARETVAVALEYPPAFLAILYSATTESMYRKSAIAECAKRFDRRGKFEEFNSTMRGMLLNEG